MHILALDAATEACSVALLTGEDVIVRSVESGKSTAQQILSLVEDVVAEAQISLSTLDAIAASVGPGAFTGVRIGVAVAQGLAFGLDLPVVPVTTLEALALQLLIADPNEAAIACLDARMGEVYWGCFVPDAAWGVIEKVPLKVSSPAEVALALDGTLKGAYRGIGRGFSAYPQLAQLSGIKLRPGDNRALPGAREFAHLGALRLAAGGAVDASELEPRYLRNKVALTEAERAAPSR